MREDLPLLGSPTTSIMLSSDAARSCCSQSRALCITCRACSRGRLVGKLHAPHHLCRAICCCGVVAGCCTLCPVNWHVCADMCVLTCRTPAAEAQLAGSTSASCCRRATAACGDIYKRPQHTASCTQQHRLPSTRTCTNLLQLAGHKVVFVEHQDVPLLFEQGV